jgi:Transposase and inactivated derivatives
MSTPGKLWDGICLFFLDTNSCLRALENALKNCSPKIINSDQGCQFTSSSWIDKVKSENILISMDGKGRWADNIYVERFWRSLKWETVYLQCFDTVEQAQIAFAKYINFYNSDRPHQSLNYKTPDQFYNEWFERKKADSMQTTPISIVITAQQPEGGAL